jgi:hypothetical protein
LRGRPKRPDKHAQKQRRFHSVSHGHAHTPQPSLAVVLRGEKIAAGMARTRLWRVKKATPKKKKPPNHLCTILPWHVVLGKGVLLSLWRPCSKMGAAEGVDTVHRHTTPVTPFTDTRHSNTVHRHKTPVNPFTNTRLPTARSRTRRSRHRQVHCPLDGRGIPVDATGTARAWPGSRGAARRPPGPAAALLGRPRWLAAATGGRRGCQASTGRRQQSRGSAVDPVACLAGMGTPPPRRVKQAGTARGLVVVHAGVALETTVPKVNAATHIHMHGGGWLEHRHGTHGGGGG